MKKISVRTRIFICLTAVFLVAGLILTGIRLSKINASYEQSAAKRWSDDRYAQVSVFWMPGEGVSPDSVYSYRQQVNSSLESESISANSDNSGTWYDAYSALTSVSAYTSRASASLQAVITGGNYFYIHSHPLICGNYYADGGESADFCVLDENAAWKLFGGLDVAGMEITIDDHIFVVCGVVRSYGNSVPSYSGEDKPTVYMPYSAPVLSDRDISVDCYEAVLPDPVDSFAFGILSDAAGGSLSVVENSSRYSYSSLWDTLKGLTDTSQRTKKEVYPHWENAARKTQTEAAVILFFETACFAAAFVSLIVSLIPAIKSLLRTWNGLKAKIRNKLDF